MNSIRNVQKAIDYEIKRQIELIEQGETIVTETRSFDASDGSTFAMRLKEGDNDYRFFPEPDLQPIQVTKEYVTEVEKTMPPLPNELFRKYTQDLNLSEYDAGVLTETKEIALYFEKVIENTKNYKAASNWVTVNIKSYLNDKAIDIEEFNIAPEKISELISLIDSSKISNSVAAQKVFPVMTENTSKSPLEIAENNNWILDSNEDALTEMIEKALAKFPEKVEEYKAGKKGLLGLFMGEVMKQAGGKIDPKTANSKLREVLEN